jgi:hypothetical protein
MTCIKVVITSLFFIEPTNLAAQSYLSQVRETKLAIQHKLQLSMSAGREDPYFTIHIPISTV